jgi:hypothetical protein
MPRRLASGWRALSAALLAFAVSGVGIAIESGRRGGLLLLPIAEAHALGCAAIAADHTSFIMVAGFVLIIINGTVIPEN